MHYLSQTNLFMWNIIKELTEWSLLGWASFYCISSSFIDHSFLDVAAPVLQALFFFFFLLAPMEMTAMTTSLLGLRGKRGSDRLLCKEVRNRTRTHMYGHTHTRTHMGLGGFTVMFVKQSAGVWRCRRANERRWKWTVAEP